MKHFKLVVTMLLVLAFVATTAFASSGVRQKQAKSVVTQGDEDQVPVRRVELLKSVNKPLSVPTLQLHPPTLYALSGDIHVGAAQAFPFNTLNNALIALQINGVGAGGVRLLLDDAAYVEASGVALGAVGGASVANPITIQPAAGTAPTITLTDNSFYGGGWTFVASNFVTLQGTADGNPAGQRDLTVQYDEAQALPAGELDGVIRLRDGCDHVTIANCKIFSMYDAGLTQARPGISMTSASGSPANTNESFDNNLITRASVGIVTVGGDNEDTGLSITKNCIGNAFGTTFGGQKDYVQREGIYFEFTNGTQLVGNQVKGIKYNIAPATIAGTTDARRLAGTYNAFGERAYMAKNIIDDLTATVAGSGTSRRAYGMRSALAFTPSGNVFVNNCITNIHGKGAVSGGDIGIEIFPGNYDTLYYNTVYHTGAQAASRACVGLQATGDQATYSAHIVAQNNVWANDRIGGAPAAAGTYRVFNGFGPDFDKLNNNVVYSPERVDALAGAGNNLAAWRAANGWDLNSSANNPNLIAAGNPHLPPAAISSAEALGDPTVPVADDHDGDARSAVGPDAGCDEDADGTTLPLDKDATPTGVTGVPATGLPFGAPATAGAIVNNNTNFSVGPFNVQMVIKDETNTVVPGGGTQSTGVVIPPWGSATVGGYASFTPTTNGPYTIEITTQLAGDANAANDFLSSSAPIVPKVTITSDYVTCFETAGDQFGWSGTDDFVLDNAFTKLGGPYQGAGTFSWVTKPGPPGTTYTEGGVLNQVLSPFFDMSGMPAGDVYMSFNHSINTEPKWDRSFMQYSVDGGATWTILGALNDANGINWYSEAVYKNALSGTAGGSCMDIGTWNAIVGAPVPAPGWSSNGGNPDGSGCDLPNTGPYGWIFVQLKLPAAISHDPFIRFRYCGFSDAGAAGDGWAFDCFKLGTGAIFQGGTISGHKYRDTNGNGVNDGEQGEAGVKVNLAYFGAQHASTLTDANGDYSFGNADVNLPGTYQVTVVNAAGDALTQPASESYSVDVTATLDDHPGNDFGNYQGTVCVHKVDDKNDNGVADGGEPGLAGWTIQLYTPDCNGTLYHTGVTDASGNVCIPAIPGTYCVKEVLNGGYRQTGTPSFTVTVSGNSGSATANVDAGTFTNFKLYTLRVEKDVDINGNGIKDLSDQTGLPLLVTEVFEVKKNGSVIFDDTLGNLIASATHANMDTGVYTVERVSPVPTGWMQTSSTDLYTYDVRTSGRVDTARWLDFKLVFANGTKYDDHNGNGVKDPGDLGLAGWTITVSGNGGSSTTTDANGNWTITGIGPGNHTISETNQAGYTQTAPPGGTYSFTAQSGNIPGANQTGKNFGNFKNVCITGVKYRDRDRNGSHGSGEEGLAGEPVTVTPQPSGTPITVQTDANGAYSVCDLGPGSYVVTAAKNPPADWQTTQPTNGSYSLTSSSGVDLAGNDFGNFRLGDTVKYRSFGSDDLSCGTPTKPVKRPKPGKPILPPNMANVLQEIYLQGGTITVGLSGQLNAGGKEKAWLGCAKFGGVLTTLCKKGVEHPDNVYRGLDFGNNGKPLLKRYKALPATIQGNDLLEDMVVMAVNIAASDYGKTTPGYGDLIYVEAGNPYDGKTLRQIKAAGDALMTNWEFHTLAEFQTIHDVIEKCNEAFRVCPTCETPDPLDTVTWMVGAKLKLTGVRSVFDVPFLRGNPGIVPVTHDVPVELPTVYALGQNYPNPFNPTTSIQFDLPEASTVTLTIYNMLGQEVATLLNHESFDAGQQEVDFDASSLSSGVYLYRLSAQAVDDDGNATGATFSQVKKMVLLK